MSIGDVHAGPNALETGTSARGTVFPVGHAAWAVPRDHLRAHYNRHDGPVDVLLAGGA
ncbi:MAG: hypothetical protein GXY82_00285 [Methanospirillum sp.]|nr:hypothetical protein [Methanospirillum sp.]